MAELDTNWDVLAGLPLNAAYPSAYVRWRPCLVMFRNVSSECKELCLAEFGSRNSWSEQ